MRPTLDLVQKEAELTLPIKTKVSTEGIECSAHCAGVLVVSDNDIRSEGPP